MSTKQNVLFYLYTRWFARADGCGLAAPLKNGHLKKMIEAERCYKCRLLFVFLRHRHLIVPTGQVQCREKLGTTKRVE